MAVLAWITGVLLIVGFGAAGAAKVTKQQQLMDAAAHLGFTQQQFQLIGVAELAGAIGVLIGLIVEDLAGLGIAAAAGLAIVGVGAVYYHRRAGDAPKDFAPPLGLAIVAMLCIIGLAGR